MRKPKTTKPTTKKRSSDAHWESTKPFEVLSEAEYKRRMGKKPKAK